MDSQGYEKSDVSIKKVFIWASGIALSIIVVVILLNSFFIAQMEKEVYESVLKPESVELRDLRAREIETLTSYKVLDEFNGVIQIPVERAMQLMAEEAFEQQLKKAK